MFDVDVRTGSLLNANKKNCVLCVGIINKGSAWLPAGSHAPDGEIYLTVNLYRYEICHECPIEGRTQGCGC